ncbi:MAG: ribose-5-phosphate isomerase RpiA [Thermoleophilia bacterium]|nr:ribose-5-phosphate isomerase RpiA [Thermoleophilia bacterium]
MGDTQNFKEIAAAAAVGMVRSGMAVGLGTGSTAACVVRRLAESLRAGELTGVTTLATSRAVRDEAARIGLPLLDDALPRDLDLTIDGADEVDPRLDLIKGAGGALLREKIVAQASRREVIVVDESKLSPRLGARRPLPVEVLPFAWRSQARFLEQLGAEVVVRRLADGTEYRTDQGDLILDCSFGPIDDPRALARELEERAGIVEHGLFLGLATVVVVGGPGGVRILDGRAGPAV